MVRNWSQTTLGAIAAKDGYGLVDGPFGSNLPASCYTESGVPVIRGSNLALGTSRFVSDEFVFVSQETTNRLARSLCRPLDIVFTKKGTLGQTGLVPENGPYEQYLLSSNQMKLTVDSRLADPLYVYYFVSSPESTEKIIRDSEATGVPKTNVTYLRDFPIALPPLPEQRAIAHILGTLDDKIELNRRMNETLEAMARALFKSWFVDFDPVRAKAEGRDPGLPKHIVDLFPDSFEDSELGEIPKGWRVGKVGEFATLSRDSINPAEFPDEVFDHFSIPAFDEGWRPKTELGVRIKSNKFVVLSNAVLVSKLNPRIPRIWLPVVRDNRRAVCSTEFLATLPRTAISREFLYSFLSSDFFGGVFETLVTGTSGSHQRVKAEGLLAMNTVIPAEPVIHQFTNVARPLLTRVNHARERSDTLASLRNTLLPKLISGELRVPPSMCYEALRT